MNTIKGKNLHPENCSKKKTKKKDPLSWWLKRIDDLRRHSDALYRLDPTVYEVGPQAVSKLSILAYYIDIYTTIMKKHFPERRICYVDLFAGCGLCRIKDRGDVILGSATLASYIPSQTQRNFDHIVLFEKNPNFVNALKKRIPNAKIYQSDVNEIELGKILNKVCGENPILAFVDPEGLDLNWSTLEQLLIKWSDVIINYQPEAVRRVHGNRDKPGYSDRLDQFFGTNDWRNIGYDDERYLNLYIKKIKKFKEIVEYIKVSGKGSYFYYILLATKKTRGNNPWLEAVKNLKQRIEKTKGDVIEQLIAIYRKEQITLC